MGISLEELEHKNTISRVVDINRSNFCSRLIGNSNDVKIGIYTSGTTGSPKCVYHSLRALLRDVKISEKHNSDVLALAYNVTHFAGVQVILQAIMNRNTIINVFGENAKEADDIIMKYSCNRISATPTYFRNYLFSTRLINSGVKSIIFGGEKFTDKLIEECKRKFPNAKVRNIYASTEARSVLVGNGEKFIIPERLSSKVKVSQDGHLLLHSSLIEGRVVDGDWYDTKDIVVLEQDGSFKFKSRETDFVNVGGYKANLIEVEECIQAFPGIVDVTVFGRENSVIGKILVADIVVEDIGNKKTTKKALVSYLKDNLQDFKVPRIINVVSELNTNRTGKKVR